MLDIFAAGSFVWPHTPLLRGDRMRLLAFGGRADCDADGTGGALIEHRYLFRAEHAEQTARLVVAATALAQPTLVYSASVAAPRWNGRADRASGTFE